MAEIAARFGTLLQVRTLHITDNSEMAKPEQNQLINNLSAGSQGCFHKLNPSLMRLQRLTDRFSSNTQV